MNDLPPGFVLDKKPAAAPGGLPPGFVLDKPQQAPQQESGGLFERLWSGMTGNDASRAGKVGMGMADPAVGMMQLGSRAPVMQDAMPFMPEEMKKAAEPDTKAVDTAVQQREQRYTEARTKAGDKPTGGFFDDMWRMLGNVASPVNLGMAAAGPAAAGASLPGRLAAGAAMGAVSGAATPATSPKEDYWSQKAKQVAAGAAAGGAVTGIGSVIGGAIAPRLQGPSQMLAEKGVQLAPGQMVGGRAGEIVRGAESKLQSFPILGDFIQGARQRSLTSYNTATINQALEPIGASLPSSIKGGRPAIEAADKAISTAFDTVLGKIPKVEADRELRNAIKAVELDARSRPAVWKTLRGELGQVTSYLRKGDSSGRELQNMASELGRRARGVSRSENFFEREVGKHLEDVRSALYDAVERQFPKEAPDLASARASSAMMIRVGNASSRRAGSEGFFTPMDLLQAIKSGASGVRRREFQHGDALMQDWAQAGQKLLPSMVPDSGTAGRLLMAELAGMFVDPMKTVLATGAATGAGLGYRAMGAAGRSAPSAGRRIAGEIGRKAGAAAAPAAGAAAAEAITPPAGVR